MDKRNRSAGGWVARMAGLVGAPIIGLAMVALAFSQEPDRTGIPSNPQVDDIFAEWNKPSSPGCAVSVIKDHGIVYKRGYGMADLDHNIPITPATVFHAASLAKQFTAMSIMLLVEQGRLSLEDDVRTYIPELPSFGTPIKVGDMLHHISGIRDQVVLVTMAGWRLSDDVVTRGDVLDLVARMKDLNFSPGDQYLYSNTNYTLAGLIVERVSGVSLAEFAHDNIFQPLEMTRTSFIRTHGEIVNHRAYGYRGIGRRFELWMPNYDLTGPTNLLTTVEDLSRWDRNFDDKTVGGEYALSQMLKPAELSDGTSAPYGLGLIFNDYRGLKTIEHDGRDAGYRSHLIRFPDHSFSVAVLCNLALPDDKLPGTLARKIADIYLGEHLAAAPPRQDIAVPAAVRPLRELRVGAYWDSWTSSLAQVSASLSFPRFCFEKGCGYLVLGDDNRGLWMGTPLAHVEIAPSSSPRGGRLFFGVDGARTLVFDAMTAAVITPADLAEYTGRYYSDEIETTYTIKLQGSSLAITRPKYPATYLEAAFRDGFTMKDFSVALPYGTVRFTRNVLGHIDGFLIDGGRVRNFRFIKSP
jgi:CubicO group peptidase (beta-lactamase class C family)